MMGVAEVFLLTNGFFITNGLEVFGVYDRQNPLVTTESFFFWLGTPPFLLLLLVMPNKYHDLIMQVPL